MVGIREKLLQRETRLQNRGITTQNDVDIAKMLLLENRLRLAEAEHKHEKIVSILSSLVKLYGETLLRKNIDAGEKDVIRFIISRAHFRLSSAVEHRASVAPSPGPLAELDY